MTKDDQYYDALSQCLRRYRSMAGDDKDIMEFITEFDRAIQNRWPLLKLNRWLGYIQGVLIERKRTTVAVERDWTRPLFRPIDFGEEKPPRLIPVPSGMPPREMLAFALVTAFLLLCGIAGAVFF